MPEIRIETRPLRESEIVASLRLSATGETFHRLRDGGIVDGDGKPVSRTERSEIIDSLTPNAVVTGPVSVFPVQSP